MDETPKKVVRRDFFVFFAAVTLQQFSARLKTVTINSVYIRSIKKRELGNVYREDLQSIL